MTTDAAVATDARIACEICGARTHSIQIHLQKDHADLGMTIAQYQEKYPGAPIFSDLALAKIEEQKRATARAAAPATIETAFTMGGKEYASELKPLHDVFGMGPTKALMSARGTPIPVTVVTSTGGFGEMVPDIDPNYVFNLDILKTLMMGLELNIPTYLWGHAGTGKTTIYEQIAARTGRAMLRVQHTANMEEEHVLGGWRLRDGKTVFELGPLPRAMKYGWLYMADEYDFGRPEVLSLYQPVLENKALVIKEADEENRIIRPHPGFRFIATGNTNGQGDETGLYQGTSLQNAANYERFGIVEKMGYMDAKIETLLVSKQTGIPADDAAKLVDFANRIRAEFDSAKLSNPISPRSLIYAGKLGMAKGNYLFGLERSYINRLSSVDREAAAQLASRVFGK